MVLVLRHVVLSAAVLASGGDRDGFAAGGGVEAAGILVGRAVVDAGAALGSKIEVWREVMGDTQDRQEQIKAATAMIREHNRPVRNLYLMAARHGHGALCGYLASEMLVTPLDVDLMRARAAYGSDVA